METLLNNVALLVDFESFDRVECCVAADGAATGKLHLLSCLGTKKSLTAASGLITSVKTNTALMPTASVTPKRCSAGVAEKAKSPNERIVLTAARKTENTPVLLPGFP